MLTRNEISEILDLVASGQLDRNEAVIKLWTQLLPEQMLPRTKLEGTVWIAMNEDNNIECSAESRDEALSNLADAHGGLEMHVFKVHVVINLAPDREADIEIDGERVQTFRVGTEGEGNDVS